MSQFIFQINRILAAASSERPGFIILTSSLPLGHLLQSGQRPASGDSHDCHDGNECEGRETTIL